MIKKIVNNSLVKGGLIVFIGSFSLNIINYIYTLVIVRILPKESYADVVSITSLLTMLTIFSGTINLIVTKFSASIKVDASENQVYYFSRKLTRNIFTLGILAFAIFIIFIPFFKDYLKLQDTISLWILSASLLVAFIVNIPQSTLQGLHRFKAFSFLQFNSGISKLLISVILVIFLPEEYKVAGAVFGMVFATFLTYIVSNFFLRDLSLIYKSKKNKYTKIQWAPLIQYAIPSFVAFMGITFLSNIDVILAKNKLVDINQASSYVALSTAGKVIFYVTGVIPTVMYPLIASKTAKKESPHRIFFGSMALVSLAGFFAYLIYEFNSDLVINLLLGSQYMSVSPLLSKFAIIMTLYSLIVLLINYFLNQQKIKVLLLPVISNIVLYLILQFGFENINLEVFTNIVFINMMTLFIIMLGYMFFSERVFILEKSRKYKFIK